MVEGVFAMRKLWEERAEKSSASFRAGDRVLNLTRNLFLNLRASGIKIKKKIMSKSRQ